MIVSSGRGFLSIIVLFVTMFLCVLIIPENTDSAFIITAFVTGLFSWYFGNKWNAKNERIVIDKKIEQGLIIKKNHTLFWIPMQYWGMIFSAFGIIILFQNSMFFGIIATVVLSIIIILIIKNRKD